MGKFIFITGGARSGKSRFAVDLAKGLGEKVVFIATCIPKDTEMKKRVSIHKKSRPAHWKVIETETDIKSALTKSSRKFDVIIIDCLGLLISNLLSDGLTEKKIQRQIRSIAEMLSMSKATCIIVSNEVGAGIVPEHRIARDFRDLLGLSNQIIAGYADSVYVTQVGIPTKIK